MLGMQSVADFPRFVPLALAAALLASLPARAAEEVPLVGQTAVHFASREEAQELLAARDEFALALSPLDRQLRLQTADEVSIERWLEFTAGEARDFSEAEVQRVKAAVEGVRERIGKFRLQLPDKIVLVRTTGKEEGNAAYTRQAAIILPEKVLAYPREQIESLLLHELFHLISRHDPALRTKLYAIVGFRPTSRIELPDSWEARRITNPDAPHVDCYIELEIENRTLLAAPLLYGTPPKYDAQRGGSLFDYLTFKLLVLRKEGERLVPELKDGRPVVIDPRGIDDFARQIGKNTNYIVHPDEILADNFVLLAGGRKEVPTPRILEEMAKQLGEK